MCHDGARVLPVSVNHCQESGVGRAEGASGSSATTGIMPGSLPAKRASRSASSCARTIGRKSLRTRRCTFLNPLISGTCDTTALIRLSMAPSTRTCPPL